MPNENDRKLRHQRIGIQRSATLRKYVRDFFIVAILPVSVIFVIIHHIARASQWQPIVLISPPFWQ